MFHLQLRPHDTTVSLLDASRQTWLAAALDPPLASTNRDFVSRSQKIIGGAAVATPPASIPSPDGDQKSRVSRPHSIEPPSSTDQSKGASPNNLPSLSTQLIIAIVRCEALAA